MARTFSSMLPLGTPAPVFALPDVVTGKTSRLEDLKGDSGSVVVFMCNHCPYVLHIQDQLIAIARQYQLRGIRFVAISSNDAVKYPEDAPEKMKQRAIEKDYPFPYLYDESQEVAKAYHAACTPDFFVFDKELKCVYRGRMDESSPGNGKPVTGNDLKDALDAVLAGKVVENDQFPSVGCNIKWKNPASI